jgi:hypothetical protein
VQLRDRYGFGYLIVGLVAAPIGLGLGIIVGNVAALICRAQGWPPLGWPIGKLVMWDTIAVWVLLHARRFKHLEHLSPTAMLGAFSLLAMRIFRGLLLPFPVFLAAGIANGVLGSILYLTIRPVDAIETTDDSAEENSD